MLGQKAKEFGKLQNVSRFSHDADRFRMPAVTNISAYRFAPLGDLERHRARWIGQCKAWNLRGTILLSTEGINLFVAGGRVEIDQLLAELRTVPGLEELTPKISESNEQPFTRMLVKIKKEIIAFGVAGIDPARNPAPRLSPRALKRWLDEGRPITLLDTRNDFEVKLGTFRNAVPIGIRHFRDFPEAVDKLPDELKTRAIVTFCTGGIRCEKAGPYLQREGFENVFQLDGGILKYFEDCGGAHFDGECFVFDKRVGLEANLEESPRTLCFVCQTPLSPEEQLDPHFVEGISCPNCFLSNDERRALELAEHRAAISRVTTPLPGSVPHENRGPVKVPVAFAGSTLIEFLHGVLGAIPFDWKAECERGNLFDSEQRPAFADHIVKEGERYYHRRPATIEPDVNADIRILYEDEALIVVDKPAPLPTRPGGQFNRNTLQSILRDVYAPQKPRPAHRLDSNTTGIVVFTRIAAYDRLVQLQFERGEVEEVYLARILGHPESGLPTRPEVRVLQRAADGTSLLEVRAQTGRADLLLTQLRHLGWPVVGDPLAFPCRALSTAAPRICLHAYRVTLTHPVTGERVAYETELPEWAGNFRAD